MNVEINAENGVIVLFLFVQQYRVTFLDQNHNE